MSWGLVTDHHPTVLVTDMWAVCHAANVGSGTSTSRTVLVAYSSSSTAVFSGYWTTEGEVDRHGAWRGFSLRELTVELISDQLNANASCSFKFLKFQNVSVNQVFLNIFRILDIFIDFGHLKNQDELPTYWKIPL